MATTNNIDDQEDDLLLIVKNNTKRLLEQPKVKPKHKLESDIQKEIVKVFIADGWQVVRYNSRKFKPDYSEVYMTCYYNYNNGMTKGHPDLTVTKDCIAIGIETKAKNGKLSDDQKRYIETSLKLGNVILVMDSASKAQDFINHTHNIDDCSIKDIALYWKETNNP